jgi:signal peptidase
MAGALPTKPVRRQPLPLPLRVIRATLASLVILAALIAVLLAVSVRHGSDGVDTIFGHPIFSVASGSMSPAIDTGDLIVEQPLTSAQATSLRTGQIVSFETAPLGSNTIIITHRIVAVVQNANGSGVQYRTKGDANNAPDQALVTPSQVVGQYQARVPLGGYVLSTLHQPLTFVILIMIPIVYLIGDEVRRRWVLYGEEDRLAKEEKLASKVVDDEPHPELVAVAAAHYPSSTEREREGRPIE